MVNKKGQAQIIYSVVAIALAMIAAGMALGIGANVTQKLTEASQKDFDAPNETKNGVINATSNQLAFTQIVNSTFKYYANNQSSGFVLLEAGNYTLNTTAGTVTLTNEGYNNSNATWDYQYRTENDAGAASNNATKGIGETAKNLPILGLVAMFGVIIVFVVAAYGGMVGRS